MLYKRSRRSIQSRHRYASPTQTNVSHANDGLKGETEEDPSVPQILLDLRRMRDEVISIQIGDPKFEETLANAFQDHSLKPAKVRKFRKAWKTDDDFEESQDFFDRMDEVFDRAILKTPDVS